MKWASFTLCMAMLGTALAWGQAPPKTIGWRTDTTGCYPDATPPLHWGPDKNVAWSAPLPGWSPSTPIIVGDRIFLTADPDWLLCVNKADGKILWQTQNPMEQLASQADKDDLAARVAARKALEPKLAELKRTRDEADAQLKADPQNPDLKARATEAGRLMSELAHQHDALPSGKGGKPNETVGWCCATPVSDGTLVATLYQNGMLVCYDLDGKLQWARYLQPLPGGYGHSASPALIGGVIAPQIESSLYGVDLKTGRTLWTDYELGHQGSPVALKVGEQEIFFTCDGNLRKAQDGSIIQRIGGALNLFTTPAVYGDTAYWIAENRRLAIAQFVPKEDGTFTVKGRQAGVEKGLYYASPVVSNGTVYLWNTVSYSLKKDPRLLLAYDAVTMKRLERLELPFPGWGYPSPTVAGPFLYAAADEGTCIVLYPTKDRTLKEIARNNIGPFAACPIFEGDRLYLRTAKALYAIVASDEDKAEAKRIIESDTTPVPQPAL